MNMSQSNFNKGFAALLITQFVEALNDNAFKLIIGLFLVTRFSELPQGTLYLSLSGIVFVLPFLLFSTYAGFLADRFSKRTIIIAVRVLELGIVSFAFYAFQSLNIMLLLTVLFLMGTHSAFFGPAKYGILPEILPKNKISEGNGLIILLTYVGIIIGKVVGGVLSKFPHEQFTHAILYLFIISFFGFVSAWFITNVKPAATTRLFQLNPLLEVIRNLRSIKKERAIFLSIIGLTYFAFLGGLFELNILVYAKNMVGADELQTSFMLVFLAMGIGMGSFLAGKFSDQKIELGLVPLGSMGLSFLCISLGFTYHSLNAVIVNLFLLGFSGGFYIVPLNALIQQESPEDKRGQIIATNNFLSFSGILIGSGILYALRQWAGLNAAQIFVICGMLTIAGTIYVCKLLPYPLVRLMIWVLAHTLYKIKVVNKHNVPDKGGALLVSNHVSFIDAVLIIVTIQRSIRFIISREVYQSSIYRPFFKLTRAIPILRNDNPKELIRALNEAREAIKNGELICIFPEGQLTRTGNLLKFNSGLEHIMKGVDAPIIPVHLDRIWGSIFSYEGGKFLKKWPKIIPYPVTISFGPPMPGNSKAFEARSRVMEMGAEAFQYRLADKVTLPEAFWREARKHPFKFCFADSSGKKLNYGTALLSSVVLADRLKGKFDQEKAIGIMIPPSVGGALVNIAISILNKVPVNLNYTASKETVASTIKQCAMQYVITTKALVEKAGMTFPCDVIFIEDIFVAIKKRHWLKAIVMSFMFPSGLSHWLIFSYKAYREKEKLATIMFTSGSTGDPKGVMLTHANIISNLEGLYQVFRIKDHDVMLGILPFFHSFGFTATLWFPLISGISVVYHVNPLDAKVVGKLVHENKATILMATPTFLNAYLRRCESEQLKSLRMVTVGAEKLKDSLAEEFKTKFGVEPMEGYGCTELSPVVSINLPDYNEKGFLQKAHKRGKIGLPLPGIAVRVVDQNTFQPLGADEEGLLLIKGPNVMKGYLNHPEKTQEVIKDGWYITGDIASMDDEGFLMITDRLSRFSKIGGEMVPHIKVEDAIHKIVNSSEQMCAVTTVADEKKGEKLVVLTTKDMDVPAVLEGLKKEGLANLWIPDSGMFFKIDNLPLLGSGKLDLGTIKKKALELTKGL